MKTLLFTILLTFCFTITWAQRTGDFEDTLQLNNSDRRVSIHVPETYDPNTKSPLVIGLHGCVGGNTPSDDFRNTLSFLGDSLGAIIACPNGIVGSAQMNEPDHLIISVAIDSLKSWYNINPDKVYLTGFSCNGFTTIKYGTRQLYPWAGIIPFNAWITDFDLGSGDFKFYTPIKTCICSGSADPAFNANSDLYDKLSIRSDAYLNEMPGIGHTTNFSTLNDEYMECFNWFKTFDLNNVTSIKNNVKVYQSGHHFEIQNLDSEMNYSLYNLMGKVIQEGITNNAALDLKSSLSGIYILKLDNNSIKIYLK